MTEPEPPARNYLFFVVVVTAALVLLVWLLSVYGDKNPGGWWFSTPPVPAPAPESAMAAESPAPEPAVPEVVLESPPEESSQPSEPQPPAGPPLRVTLDFLSDCWVETAVDGNKRLSELKVQGESLLLDAEELVEFKVGDVGAVQVEVNGLPFEIEDRKGTSVRTVRIDLEAAAAVAAAAAGPPAEESDGTQRDELEP